MISARRGGRCGAARPPAAGPRAGHARALTPASAQDERCCIGTLSTRTRRVRVVNTLTEQETLLEVGSEETLEEIQDRYLEHNAHAGSYTWKALKVGGPSAHGTGGASARSRAHARCATLPQDGEFRPLDMTLTLEENGVHDESDEFEELSISEDFYIPVLHLYFNDDLTVA